MDDARTRRSMRDAGGTSGGIGTFLLGAIMAVGGGYLLLNQVVVTGSFWRMFGYDLFGLSLVPFLVGLGLVFYNGRSVLGWLLIFAGAVIIVTGVIANMTVYFRSTSLFNTLIMFILLVGGLGLVARSLRPS